MERAAAALDGLLRVTRRGGIVLLSVMSLLGATRRFLTRILAWAKARGLEDVEHVIRTGNQDGAMAGRHHCHLYRWSELRALFERHACSLVAVSAANFLSVGASSTDVDDDLWSAFLRHERDFCREEGCLDGGTHIVAALRR